MQQPTSSRHPAYFAAEAASAKRRREKENRNDEPSSPWRAMKRLRVEEPWSLQQQQALASASSVSSREEESSHSSHHHHHHPTHRELSVNAPFHRVSQDDSPYPLHQQAAATGGGEADTTTDYYSSVNHLLGALHQQRLSRAAAAQQQVTAPLAADWSSRYPQQRPNDVPATTTVGNRSRAISDTMESGQQQQQRGGRVVHLQTNSKLG